MSSTRIYLVAGEPSGDALGADLMRHIKAQCPDCHFYGIGGESMIAEGLESLFPYRELSIMGFMEVLPHIPKMLARIKKTAQHVARIQPHAVITIDSPGFTFRLAQTLRDTKETADIPRVHYVAPSVWAYKPKRAAKTARLYNLLLTLLPFEPPYFEKEGLKSIFVGHPVLWQDWNADAAAFRNKHSIAADAKLLLLLPGSRPGEIKSHLSLFLEVAKSLPDYVPLILAGSLVHGLVRSMAGESAVIADISEKKEAFAAANMALSKSGTVTLELAAAHVPMTVTYKVNPLSAWMIRRMIRIKYASLVNIAVNREIVPEYIQEKSTVENLTRAMLELADPAVQQKQRQECEQAIATLHGNNTIQPGITGAKAILDLIRA